MVNMLCDLCSVVILAEQFKQTYFKFWKCKGMCKRKKPERVKKRRNKGKVYFLFLSKDKDHHKEDVCARFIVFSVPFSPGL